MTILHAQPYDTSATGFYFDSKDSFQAKAQTNRNDFGHPVEEYEIQFINGEAIDCALADAWNINQVNIGGYFDVVDGWEYGDKLIFIVAVGEVGYDY